MILTTGMDEHPRTIIREALIALLVSANTAAGDRVDDTRVDPLKKGKLPALSVYTLSEPVDPASRETRPRELTRELKVEIVGWVGRTDDLSVAKAMDRLARQVEAAIDRDPYLGELAADSVLDGTDMEVVEEDGNSDPVVGTLVLTYSITYRTTTAALALEDFREAEATHKPTGGVADTAPAVDRFTVEETPS